MLPDAGTDPGGRWRALVALGVCTLLSMTTWFSASAVVPQLRAAWQLGSAAAAGLTVAVQVGFVLGAVGAAVTSLPDVVPGRVLLPVASVGAAAANLGLLAVHGPAAATFLRGATGVFLAGVYPTALRQMSTWFRRQRGTALGLMVAALTLGSAAPHLVNGLGGARWQVVIATTSALTAAGGLLSRFVVHDGPYPFPAARFAPRRAVAVLVDRRLRLVTAGYLGHMWELYAMWAWFAVFAATRFPGPPAAVLTFAVVGLGAVGCWLGGVVGDRWGRARSTIAAMTVSGACAAAVGPLLAGPVWAFLLVAGLWGTSVVADSAQFSALVTELGEQAYVGTALTVQLALGFALTTATILVVPYAAGAFGWQYAFLTLVPGPLLGVLAMSRLMQVTGPSGSGREVAGPCTWGVPDGGAAR